MRAPHTAIIVRQALDETQIEVMDCLPISPDLSTLGTSGQPCHYTEYCIV